MHQPYQPSYRRPDPESAHGRVSTVRKPESANSHFMTCQKFIRPSDSRSGADNRHSLTAVRYRETMSNDTEIQSNFKMGQSAQILGQNQA